MFVNTLLRKMKCVTIAVGKRRDDVITLKSNNSGDTYELGKDYAKSAYAGEVIALDGDLGCGKTVFAKGFADGLGIKEPVTSPTFTILRQYEDGRLPLYHFDVYRIEASDEMLETGFDEYIGGDGVCIIEWAENVRDILPDDTVWIKIKKDDTDAFESRIIEISGGREKI